MADSEDPAHTLQEIFEMIFTRSWVFRNGVAGALEEFYDNIFPGIGSRPPAPRCCPIDGVGIFQGVSCRHCHRPAFPLKATHHRLRWAGLDPAQFEIVSSFENFHFSKSHTAYYAEILGRLGWPDEPVLMVGNDADRDLMPAHRLGLKTYFIDVNPPPVQEIEVGAGQI